MRNVVVAVVLIVLVAGSLGIGYFAGYSRQTVSNPVIGSFSFSPLGQVKVDKVWATETLASNGRDNVTFWVTFENTGTSPVYAIGGWVSALDASISGSTSVIQSSASRFCPGAIYLVTLNQGQNATVYAPDCASGFNYQLVHPGSVAMVLSFGWTTNRQESTPFPNVTTIQASFNFG